MKKAFPFLIPVLLVVWLAGIAPVPALAGDDDDVRLEIELKAEATDEPIAYASVYVKYEKDRFLRGNKKKELSSKTNNEGKAVFPAIPAGRVLVQVVAKGWKTYGRYYEIEGPKQILEIKLKPAQKWY